MNLAPAIRRRFRPLAPLAGILMLLAGCALPDPDDLVVGRSFRPSNVHVETRRLNPQLRRVLLLPLTSEAPGTPAADALPSVAETLRSELQRTRRFEVVQVTGDELLDLSGRSGWRAGEPLPPDLLARLREAHLCDAVLFAHLTRYQAYPPLAVGWQLKLVGCPTPQVLWECDETFDARDGEVVNGARRFQQSDQAVGRRPGDSRIILSSPRRFAAYAAATAFETLPDN